MMRKFLLAAAAGAALGATALIPTTASAFGGHWHGGWHRGWHGFYAPVYVGPAYGGCVVRRWVPTAYGPRLRWVNICY